MKKCVKSKSGVAPGPAVIDMQSSTAYYIWSVVSLSRLSNLNRWSRSQGLFPQIPLERTPWHWDRKLRWKTLTPNVNGRICANCRLSHESHNLRLSFHTLHHPSPTGALLSAMHRFCSKWFGRRIGYADRLDCATHVFFGLQRLLPPSTQSPILVNILWRAFVTWNFCNLEENWNVAWKFRKCVSSDW